MRKFLKSMVLFVSLIFAAAGVTAAEEDIWVPQISGTDVELYGVSFTSKTTGIVTGGGALLKTTDGGLTWEEKTYPSEVSPFDVSFCDENNGMIIDMRMYAMSTTDGGETWESHSTGLGGRVPLNRLQNISPGVAVAVGNKVIKTTDNGETWTDITPSGIGSELVGLYFVNENVGTVTGFDGAIYRTTDGGTTWTAQTSPVGGANLYATYFIDENTGYVAGDGTILKTTDGGANWNIQVSGTGDSFWDIEFGDENMGTAVSLTGSILYTDDGGEVWNEEYTSSQLFYSVSIAEGDAWAVGMDGVIFYRKSEVVEPPTAAPTELTAIAGEFDVTLNWVDNTENESGFVIERKEGDSLSTNSFAEIGIVSADSTSYIDTGLVKDQHFSYRVYAYNVGGNSDYSNVADPGPVLGLLPPPAPTNVQVIMDGLEPNVVWQNNSEKELGYVVERKMGDTTSTNEFIVLDTLGVDETRFTDDPVTFPTHYTYRVYAYNSTGNSEYSSMVYTGELVENNKWAALSSGTTDDLYGVWFSDLYNGAVVGGTGDSLAPVILTTTDGGLTWNERSAGIKGILNDVVFSDADNGIVVGNGGRVLTTSDGGEGWFIRSSGTTDNLKRIVLVSEATGWAIGENGTIIKTEDGGTSWTIQYNNSSYKLYDIYFADESNGAAAGQDVSTGNSLILWTANGGSGWNVMDAGIGGVSSTVFTGVYLNETGNYVAAGSDVDTSAGMVLISSADSIASSFGFIETPNRMSFMNDSTAVITGYENADTTGSILITVDGGKNWYHEENGNYSPLHGISYVDENTVWVVGEDGVILHKNGELTAPSAPANLIAKADTSLMITLVWDDNSFSEDGFIVERLEGDTTNTFEIVDSLASNTTVYNDEAVLENVKYTYRMRSYNSVGMSGYSNTAGATVILTGIEDESVPSVYALEQNYPNPFNPSTVIEFRLPYDSNVKVVIYNVLGQKVTELVNKQLSSGSHEVRWNASNLSSGMYIYRMSAKSVSGDKTFTSIKKMMLLK